MGVADGIAIHVGGAIPGDVAIATIAHLSPHRPHAWASLATIARASPDRVPSQCPHGGTGHCGGCVLQAWDYNRQLDYKAARVAELLSGLGLEKSRLAPIRPSPALYGYRNQVKLVAEGDGSSIRLGAYAPGSHAVVDMHGCAAPEPALVALMNRLPTLLDRAQIAPFDPVGKSGALRYVLLRANLEGQVLLTLVTWPGRSLCGAEIDTDQLTSTTSASLPHTWRARLLDLLAAEHPEIIGVLHNENGATSGRLLGETTHLLTGARHLPDAIGHARVLVSSSAFLQANRRQAESMYGQVLTDLGLAPGMTGARLQVVIDAYAGVGSIAFFLAPYAQRIVAIEANQAASSDAALAAQRYGVANVTMVCRDAGDGLAAERHADAIVLNPPRKGCAPTVLREVLRLRPARLVYVSCAPQTFARDAAVLAQAGYACTAVTPFDLFPHTPHIELVAAFA